MNSTNLADLKQFISATISQQLVLQTNEIEEKIESLDTKLSGQIRALDTKLSGQISALDTKLSRQIKQLSLAVGEALDISNGENQKQLNNHEKRITRLELSSQ